MAPEAMERKPPSVSETVSFVRKWYVNIQQKKIKTNFGVRLGLQGPSV